MQSPQPQEELERLINRSRSPDLYVRLGVQNTASEDEIKAAYRNLARKTHPDLVANHPRAAELSKAFKSFTEAVETLQDADRRRRYDRPGGRENAAPDLSGARFRDPMHEYISRHTAAVQYYFENGNYRMGVQHAHAAKLTLGFLHDIAAAHIVELLADDREFPRYALVLHEVPEAQLLVSRTALRQAALWRAQRCISAGLHTHARDLSLDFQLPPGGFQLSAQRRFAGLQGDMAGYREYQDLMQLMGKAKREFTVSNASHAAAGRFVDSLLKNGHYLQAVSVSEDFARRFDNIVLEKAAKTIVGLLDGKKQLIEVHQKLEQLGRLSRSAKDIASLQHSAYERGQRALLRNDAAEFQLLQSIFNIESGNVHAPTESEFQRSLLELAKAPKDLLMLNGTCAPDKYRTPDTLRVATELYVQLVVRGDVWSGRALKAYMRVTSAQAEIAVLAELLLRLDSAGHNARDETRAILNLAGELPQQVLMNQRVRDAGFSAYQRCVARGETQSASRLAETFDLNSLYRLKKRLLG